MSETVMRRFVAEVINQARYDVIDEIVHPEYVYRSPADEIRGPDGLKAFLTGYRTAIPNLKMVVDEMVAAGETTVTFFTPTGTNTGEMMGMPPTGKEIEVHGVVRTRVRDGKLIEEWELVDMLAMFAQLGIVSLPR